MTQQGLSSSSRPVARWLLLGVFITIIQIALGGITRLTGSGLSITEWKPIVGAIPPLTEIEWHRSFQKYQKIAQYKQLNAHFTLSDFKFIFFWEWFHRLWGRLLGLAFIIPFLVFLLKGYFSQWMLKPLIGLFLLGALQGVLGWIMVKSGLNDTNLYVSHIRLSIHFLAALVLLVYNFVFYLRLTFPRQFLAGSRSLRSFTWVITGFAVLQLVYGAFMAGLKAGVYAPTWPDINGNYFPEILKAGISQGLLSNLVNHAVAVHFVHRNLAYLLAVLIVIWTEKASKIAGPPLFQVAKWVPSGLTLAQIALGVLATITSYKAIPQGWGEFEWFAQLHQLGGILLLLSFVFWIYVLRVEGGRKE